MRLPENAYLKTAAMSAGAFFDSQEKSSTVIERRDGVYGLNSFIAMLGDLFPGEVGTPEQQVIGGAQVDPGEALQPVESLVEFCRRGPSGAVVRSIEVEWEPPEGEEGFVIR